MGIHVIKMPDIGEGIAEVELVVWHVQPGDVVSEDQVLADVMTDKATIEIPSPVAGAVLALGGKAGQVMAVGAELIRIEVAGISNVGNASGAVVSAAEPNLPDLPDLPPPAAAVAAPSPRKIPAPDHPAAARQACEKPIASPALRRRAWDLDIDLQYVQGSGAGGRIMQQDLDAHVANIARRAAPPSGVKSELRYQQRDDEQALPVIGLRRKIAQKMQESKRRIPHFTYVEEIDVTELEALRTKLNHQWGAERGRLTLLPLLMRAVVLGVREFPQINARFDDDAGIVTRYSAVHIGIATQTGAGLVVPVLRHAEARDVWSCATEMTRLTDAARSGKATRDELSGSTITITSLGALGGIVSTPVINHPEVAIVGVNKMVERPVMRGGLVVARKMMNLSSSFDHRVVDGIHAAEFIQALRGYLECPATLFVE